jgi:hypothetical protein
VELSTTNALVRDLLVHRGMVVAVHVLATHADVHRGTDCSVSGDRWGAGRDEHDSSEKHVSQEKRSNSRACHGPKFELLSRLLEFLAANMQITGGMP